MVRVSLDTIDSKEAPMVELVAVKSNRLQAAIQRAEETAQLRGEDPEDYIAGAIEDKLNQARYAYERAQG